MARHRSLHHPGHHRRIPRGRGGDGPVGSGGRIGFGCVVWLQIRGDGTHFVWIPHPHRWFQDAGNKQGFGRSPQGLMGWPGSLRLCQGVFQTLFSSSEAPISRASASKARFTTRLPRAMAKWAPM